jgi:hypothetical protein
MEELNESEELNISNDTNKETPYDFEAGDDLSDLKLKVEDKIFHVHRAILGSFDHFT